VLTGAYEDDEFLTDLHRVNGGESDAALSRLLIERSRECAGWMERHGVRFQAALRGTLHLSRTNAFFLGGGKALMNAYYAAASRLGIDVLYDAEVVGSTSTAVRFALRRSSSGGERRVVLARAAVVATGGFESNLEWLKEAWGDAADQFIVRGTPYNTGAAAPPARRRRRARGRPARLSRHCGGRTRAALRRRHRDAARLHSTRLWSSTSTASASRTRVRTCGPGATRAGARSWRAAGQQAYCLVDAKTHRPVHAVGVSPVAAPSIRELATALELPPDRVARDGGRFNASVRPGTFDLETLDGCRTEG
jgi:tricarballylate dehydrogenase